MAPTEAGNFWEFPKVRNSLQARWLLFHWRTNATMFQIIKTDIRNLYNIPETKDFSLLFAFNPSHEMALVRNCADYAPTKNVAMMEKQLWKLPFIWAGEDDCVFNIGTGEIFDAHGNRVDMSSRILIPFPWGWNLAVRERFLEAGIDERVMPGEGCLQTLRTFAGRSFACDYIHELLSSIPADMRDRLVGNHMKFHQSIDTVRFDAAMMIFKQPWSSSGRGNFCAASLDEMTVKRLEASVKKQGGFLADIFYHKTLDFAMEFYVFADGNVEFIGYSLFQAEKNGKYVGNMVESQKIVRKTIALAMGGDNGLLDALKEKHLEMLRRTVAGQYCGFVGIDMMVVNNEDHISVHPCVEINFRMNMGIIAMYAYLRPFLFDFLEEEEDSEEGAVWRSSILEPPSLMRERGFHTVLKSRFISIRYS